MSSNLFFLLILLLTSCITVKAGNGACPGAMLEAPSASDSAVRNVPLIDTDYTTLGLFVGSPIGSNNFLLRDECPAKYVACHTPPQDNWLVAPVQAIDNGLRINTVQALFTFTLNCTDFNCSGSFGLYSLNYNSTSERGNFSAYNEVVSPPTNGTPVSISLSMTASHLAVALRDTGTCVTVDRIQVYYESCVVDFASITEIPFGNDGVTVSCVSNAVNNNVIASCSETGVLSPATPCECQAGYSGGDGVSCIACGAGMYKSTTGSGSCTSCPMFSNTSSIASTECVCVKGHQRSNPADVTLDCDQCLPGYYRSTASESLGECVQCPMGSNSTGGAVSECTCNDGLATAVGSVTTTSDRCDRCRADYYRDGGCVRCPAMSSRMIDDSETVCTCATGRATDAGATTTSGDDCTSCQVMHYRTGDTCSPCPSGSYSSTPTATTCTCNPGYNRFSGIMESTTEDCFVILGFTVDRVTTPEDSDVIVTIRAGEPTSVQVTITSTDTGVVTVRSPVAFDNSSEVNVTLDVQENEVAFNRYVPVMVAIQTGATSQYIDGGTIDAMTVYSSVTVDVTEDDTVTVGFTAQRVSFNETDRSGTVTVMRVGDILSDLRLNISQSGPNIITLNSPTVTFRPNEDATQMVTFSIINDNSGSDPVRGVTLELVLDSPTEFVSDVLIGGESGPYSSVVVNIVNDDIPPTPIPLGLEAIIGIAVGGAFVILLALIILILIICICHLRSVKRQGFYTTYEDQSKEPPTMLRYSASLRSISSQTVVPVENTQGSVAKENEFYV